MAFVGSLSTIVTHLLVAQQCAEYVRAGGRERIFPPVIVGKHLSHRRLDLAQPLDLIEAFAQDCGRNARSALEQPQFRDSFIGHVSPLAAEPLVIASAAAWMNRAATWGTIALP
jgi:hypothetical protein